MPRYVLFCNERYGRPFERAFRRWCAANRSTDFLVVRSTRDEPADRSLPARLRRLGQRARTMASGRRDHVALASDVNDAAFLGKWLAPGGDLFGLVAGFNQIFREETIRRFTALLNFHPSLLPYYRGPVPSWWCIHNGETSTGVTLHVVTPEIDAGPILWQTAIPIQTRDDAALDQALARAGAAVLPDVMDSLRTNTPLPASRLDAARVYRTRAGYLSFPEAERAQASAGGSGR
jgi:methionyl-tRNA formyltransferase